MSAPNLLYVLADEWRAQAVGALGQDPVFTPNIDALAAEGVACTSAVSTDPVCSPHRAMLLTGQYAPRNGVVANCNSATAPMGLDPDARCWSDVLSDAGYDCGYIGKWHLDPPTPEDEVWGEGRRPGGAVWDTWTPPHRRHSFNFWYSYGCCDDHLNPHYWTSGSGPEDRIDVDCWSAEHETNVAIDFLRRRDPNRPFALVVSYNPPHMPFDAVPSRYLDIYRDASSEELLVRPNVDTSREPGSEALDGVRPYFAAVSGIDEQVGRLISELKAQGILDETLVVLTSDHGEAMGSQGLMGKRTWFEESLRVPFIWRYPAQLAPRTDDILLATPDIYPTLLGLLGLAAQVPPSVEGRDLSAALRGEQGAERPEVALYAHLSTLDVTGPARGIVTDRWTYAVRGPAFHTAGPGDLFLYDNVEDPFQLCNLAQHVMPVREELHSVLQAELARHGYPG